MKKYLAAILALASALFLAAAPSMATPATYVDFNFPSVINSLTTSGIGSVSQNSGTTWTITGYGSDGITVTGSIGVTGGLLTFSSGGNVTFSGTISGGGTFNLTGTANGYSYTPTPNQQWDWSDVTWTSLTGLNYGSFEVSGNAYNGSFSVDTTGTVLKRYIAQGTFSEVPVPSTLLLLAPSMVGIMVMLRKKRKK
jgi:hypothetical protein